MKRWQIITILSVIAVSLFIGVRVKSTAAQGLSITKPERQYTIKILNKLEEVLVNQHQILRELAEMREAAEQ
jgi:hypothetical protein